MQKFFTVDARAMLTWGRESIKDHTTAVLELVKNSYDANATVVVVEIVIAASQAEPQIRIVDNGVGMSAKTLEENWLRLGYSEKRDSRFTARGRRKTGEKGVGRISADRLGALLELRSQAKNKPSSGLNVDWKLFEASGRDLSEVPVQELQRPSFKIPRPAKEVGKTAEFAPLPIPYDNGELRTGTELIIRELRQEWDIEDIRTLHRMLSLLTPPFERVTDFQIRLVTDIDPSLNGVVVSPLYSAAAVEVRLSLDNKGTVTGSLVDRSTVRKMQRAETKVHETILELVHPIVRSREHRDVKGLAKLLGPVETTLLFYPQKSETLRTLEIEMGELREFLQVNAGVKVYRDGIRVPPYGDQGRSEGDWLGLGERKTRQPAGPNRADFRVSPYQLVGAVFIGRDSNPELVDTSGREGLVAGEAFQLLRQFLIGCMIKLESHYHQIFVRSRGEAATEQPSPRDTVQVLRDELSALSDSIKEAGQRLPDGAAKQFGRVVRRLETTADSLKKAEKSLDELASQAIVSRTLATIGIAAATFGHETERGLDSMKASVEAARLLIQNGDDTSEVLEELEKALLEAKRVSAWGAFALGRVQKDKRKRQVVPVHDIVDSVIESIRPAFESSSITLSADLEPVRSKVFPMDVECVLINFLANAYYFSKQTRRERHVAVRLRAKKHGDRSGVSLTVSDSGPGIRAASAERVWDPLYTTKVDRDGRAIGTGLGLALVAAVIHDADGTRTLDRDPKLSGARFTVWLPDGRG